MSKCGDDEQGNGQWSESAYFLSCPLRNTPSSTHGPLLPTTYTGLLRFSRHITLCPLARETSTWSSAAAAFSDGTLSKPFSPAGTPCPSSTSFSATTTCRSTRETSARRSRSPTRCARCVQACLVSALHVLNGKCRTERRDLHHPHGVPHAWSGRPCALLEGQC